MYQAVEDGVSGRGIADQLVPGVDRVLAGDQGGPGALAVVEDLEEESVLVGFQGSRWQLVTQRGDPLFGAITSESQEDGRMQNRRPDPVRRKRSTGRGG